MLAIGGGIRCIKYFAWEKPYLQRVFGLRTHESLGEFLAHWLL